MAPFGESGSTRVKTLPIPGSPGYPYLAAVELDESFGECQPEPGSVLLPRGSGIELPECFEDFFLIGLVSVTEISTVSASRCAPIVT